MRLAMIVEYHGKGYSGFQYQENAPTVQQQIEKAIQSLTGQPVRIKAAGRTDAGVHALGQVVAFDTNANYPPEVFLNALNARLPRDIAVREAYRARPDFDPRRDAISRLYRYTLLVSKVRSPVWRHNSHQVRPPLALDSMREAASLMVGTHDFANFGGPLERPGSQYGTPDIRDRYNVQRGVHIPGDRGKRLPAKAGEADGGRAHRRGRRKIEIRGHKKTDFESGGRSGGALPAAARFVLSKREVRGFSSAT